MHELKIDRNQTIGNLQNQFKGIYPYLNIEFFSMPHGAGQPTSKKFLISNSRRLGELMPSKSEEGVIQFDDGTTVAKLEQDFKMNFGLNAQLFRKSGRIWLEITNTDSWTMLQQNEEGKSFEFDTRVEEDSPDDHDIY